MKKTKYKYFKTLGESIKLVLQNPKIFLPLIISLVVGMFSIPFVINLQSTLVQGTILSKLIIFYIIMAAWSIFIYGWTFALINQLIKKKKLDLFKSIKRSFSFGIRLLGIGIFATLILFMIYLIIIILISILMKIPGIGSILSVIFGICLIIFLVFYSTAMIQTIPVLIVEDKGLTHTLKTAIRFYLKKKLFSLNIAILAMLAIFIPSLPAMIYQTKIMFFAISTGQIFLWTKDQLLALDFLYMLPMLFFVAVIVYYCKSYQEKKSTIK